MRLKTFNVLFPHASGALSLRTDFDGGQKRGNERKFDALITVSEKHTLIKKEIYF